MDKDYVSPSKAALLSRINVVMIKKNCSSGQLKSFKLPGSNHRRILISDLKNWMLLNNLPIDLIKD